MYDIDNLSFDINKNIDAVSTPTPNKKQQP